MSPNLGYFALMSNSEIPDNRGPLYLSSDGKGNMKLKPSNSAYFGPPLPNPFIDTALLFRFVEPDGSP